MLTRTFLCFFLIISFGWAQEEEKINEIVKENQKKGTPSHVWDISGAGDPSIQGFATQMSYIPGETVKLKIKTDATKYRVDFYRLGYYNGDGARLIGRAKPNEDNLPYIQPDCYFEKETMLYDCSGWEVGVEWEVPEGVVSGVFVGRVVREDGGGVERETWRVDGSKVGKDVRFGMDGEFKKSEAAPHAYGASGHGSLKNKIVEPSASHIYFVVRQKKRSSDILIQTSDTTWQAYNTYGGTSTYGSWNAANPQPRAYIASYNRPLKTRDTRPINTIWTSEYPLIRWMEKNGYDVSYQSGIDTARLGVGWGGEGEGGTEREEEGGHKVFISSGHDEYWSGGQRRVIERAREKGMHLMFLSGNEMFWKIRWEGLKNHVKEKKIVYSEENDENDYRLMVCYKESQEKQKIDPEKNIWTGTFRDPRDINPEKTTPENSITGTIFTVNAWRDDPLLVPSDFSSLRFWRNTSIADLEEGETKILKQGLLGHEWDEDINNGYRPPGLFHLSSTFVDNVLYIQDWGETYDSGSATHHLVMHKYKSGAIVFGAGTCQWSWGLDSVRQFGVIQHAHNFLNPRIGTDLSGTSVDVEQATANILADMGVLPLSLSPHLVLPTPSRDFDPPISALLKLFPLSFSPSLPFVLLKISAFDVGGGCVAGVEVSLDNHHFYPARRFKKNQDEQFVGAEHSELPCSPTWVAEIPVHDFKKNTPEKTCIFMRAVDDSGNIEEVEQESCNNAIFLEWSGKNKGRYYFL